MTKELVSFDTAANSLPASVTTALNATYAAPAVIVKAGDEVDLRAKVIATTTGDILIPRGTYTLTASVTPNAGVTLRGEGDKTILKLPNGARWNAIVVTTADVTVRDVHLDGNKANTSYGQNGLYSTGARTKFINCYVHDFNGYNIVGFPGASDLLVQGCVTENAASEGIEFQGVTRGSCVGNMVRDNGANGIYIWNSSGTSSDITISGNTVSTSSQRLGAAGIRVDDGATNVTISSNILKDGTANSYGISVYSSTANIVSNVSGSGNSVSGSLLTTGIYGGANVRGMTVSGNAVADIGGGTGIQLAVNVAYSTVTGNTVSGCKTSGIWIDANDVVVNGNCCVNNGQGQSSNAGIFSDGDNVIISSNRCFDNQGTKTQAFGIRVYSGHNVHLSANLVEGNLTTGLSVGTPTNLNSVPYRKFAATVGATQTAVAHGLPYIPISVTVTMTGAGAVWRSAASDVTNVYLTADAATRSCDVLVG